jgi:hypothetical protein
MLGWAECWAETEIFCWVCDCLTGTRGLPMGKIRSPPRTHLTPGRVWAPPTGEKWYPCPSPSGRVPGGYPVPVPELPSLMHAKENKSGDISHMQYWLKLKKSINHKPNIKISDRTIGFVTNKNFETRSHFTIFWQTFLFVFFNYSYIFCYR